MGKIFTDAARAAAQEAYENEHETRWDQLSAGYQNELILEAHDQLDAEEPKWTPITKPTDQEIKAELRKIFSKVANENNLADQEYIDFIDNSVEEMFAVMKRNFG